MLLLHVLADQHRRVRTKLFDVSIELLDLSDVCNLYWVPEEQEPPSGLPLLPDREANPSLPIEMSWNVHELGQSGNKNGVSQQEPSLNSAVTRRQILLRREILRFMMNQNKSNWINRFSRWFTESNPTSRIFKSRLAWAKAFRVSKFGGIRGQHPRPSSDSVALRYFLWYVVMCCDINPRHSSKCFQTVRVILNDFGPLQVETV